MRIQCVTESLSGGGAEHQLAILASLLCEQGYDVTLVTYADLKDHYSLHSKIKRVRLGVGKSALGKVFSIWLYFLRCKTDCIISYRQRCSARVLIPFLFFKRSVRIICSERNLTVSRPSLYELLLFNLLYKRANAIVTNSYSQYRYIETNKPTLVVKLSCILNYTDIDHYMSTSIPDTDCIKVGVFARFSDQKNPIGFAKAVKQLTQITSQEFEIHWYGTQYDKDGKPYPEFLLLQDTITHLSLRDVFYLHDAVDDVFTEMPNYHAISLPSFYEGFSNSIAEGISCGKPMLVSNVSDNPLMVRDGVNGFLFDPRDELSIVSAYTRLFAVGRDGLIQMGKNSRIIAEELFNKNRFINEYKKLIEE